MTPPIKVCPECYFPEMTAFRTILTYKCPKCKFKIEIDDYTERIMALNEEEMLKIDKIYKLYRDQYGNIYI